MRELLIATSNKGKLPGILEGLGKIPFKVFTLNDVKMPDGFEADEPGSTYEAHSAIKAILYGKHSGMLCLADDSGLEVDALPGELGVHTKNFYDGTKAERITELLRRLADVSDEKRTARYRDVIAMYDPKNDKVRFAEGVCEGRILKEPKGENGFGFGQIFLSNDLQKTFGEASIAETNRVSHRGRALKKAREILLAEFL